MKPAITLAEAEEEAAEAARFYENRVTGLGVDFLAEVDAAITAIELAPHLWPNRKFGTRRYLLHRFPYSLIYLELPDRIWIVAVAHASRRPYYWRKRLRTAG